MNKNETFKRLSLRIPKEIWKSAKIRLVEKGTSFQAFLLEKLKEIAEERKPHGGLD